MKDIEKVCEACGKRLPTRNNQRNLECTKQGLCRECYENAYLVCEKCGCDLPKGKGLKSIAARTADCCLDCYEPEMDINQPGDSPWGWNESVRILYDEIDEYER